MPILSENSTRLLLEDLNRLLYEGEVAQTATPIEAVMAAGIGFHGILLENGYRLLQEGALSLGGLGLLLEGGVGPAAPVIIFTPPTVRDRPLGYDRLFRHFRNELRGVNVWKLIDGTYTQREPFDLALVAITYHGGHEYPVSAAEAASLTTAGYGANLVVFAAPDEGPPPGSVAPTSITGSLGTPLTVGINSVAAFTSSGTPAPVYIVTIGTLPAGLVLNALTGEVTGRPTVAGPYAFVLSAVNVAGSVSTPWQSGSVLTGSTAPSAPVGALPTLVVGTPMSATFTSSGTPAPTFSIATGSLPAGLSLNAVSGVISGTPTTATAYSFALRATNTAGSATGATIAGTVAGIAPSVPAGTLGALLVGTPKSTAYTSTGTPAPTFSIFSGALPTGLTMSAAGAITGTPTVAGAYSFVVRASNSAGVANSPTQSGTVNQVPSTPAGTLGTIQIGVPVSVTFTSTGTPAPTWSITAGALPAGLALNAASGLVSGTPTSGTTYSFTITATNTVGSAGAAKSGTINPAASAPTFVNGSLGTCTVGTPVSVQFTSNGFPAPTFAIFSGALPAGLSMSSAGLITGTPTTPGAYTFVARATNASGSADSAIKTGTTDPAPVPGTWPATRSLVGYRHALSAPGASGTGWAKAGSVITTNAASARLTDLDLTGITVIAAHTDCILADCLLDVGPPGSNNCPLQIRNAATNGQVLHCELKGGYTLIGGERTGGGFNPGSGWLIDWCLLSGGMENAINPNPGWVISNSIIRRFGRVDVASPPHYDGVECFGGENGVTVYNCVIFLTSAGFGTDAGAIDTWLPDTGTVNLFGNIDDFNMYDCLIGGGSSTLNFDDAGGAPGNTNIRIGSDRLGVIRPVYIVRNSGGQDVRDDTNVTYVGWNVRYAEDNASNGDTFNNTLTTDAIPVPH